MSGHSLKQPDSELTNRSGHHVPGTSKYEQILQGAMRVFLQHGYASTSMDRVAAEAGVSKQTIYSHFQDKEGLFIALIERVTTRRFQIEFGPEPFHGEPATLLRRLAETLLSKMADQEYIAFIRTVIAESERFPELAQLYLRTVLQYGMHGLTTYFDSRPELNLPDSEATARIFFGSLVAFVLAQEVLHGKEIMPMESDRLVNSLVRLVLGSA
ncbi:MAG: TetR/AcrR family transcriptional regulator [Gemmatimonadaceae bacterium]|nr:TetR/AcrR family transcriptional regulator [Gloeobacterales cyanobacterium ES-bin-141]